jgi:hypothetical protein
LPRRAEIIREVFELLNAEDRHWTSRLVQLWFTNNKKHYTDDRFSHPPPPRRLRLPPIPPYQCGFIPMNVQPIPITSPMMWPMDRFESAGFARVHLR